MTTQTLVTRLKQLVLCSACLLLSNSALSNPYGRVSDTPPSVRVSYADLNLANPEGAAALYRRLQGATAKVCRSQYSMSYNVVRRAVMKCRQKALADAVNSVKNEHLAAIHRVKEPRRFG